MPGVCILTDSTAQFTVANFPGRELVSCIPLHIQLAGKSYLDGEALQISDLPASAYDGKSPRVWAPSPEDFRQTFLSLSRDHQEIMAVLLSARLSLAFENAETAATHSQLGAALSVVDSQTTGVGLGLLIQAAAQAAWQGASALEIQRLLRQKATHVYTIFCVQSLTYLTSGGHFDPAQALIGEMLGVSPLIVLENGRLVPFQKVRNPRHLIDLLVEFLGEFGELEHIALSKGALPFDFDTRSLRERISAVFPRTDYSEHTLGTGLAAILGPRSLGLVAVEG